MGELILCNSRISANSYYIEDASLNIYSLEELCFYIYNNSYMLDDSFISPGLIKWIATEIKDPLLAKELSDMVEDGARLNIIIGHLLRNNGYLTKNEIKSCLDIISGFEGKTEAEARKIRADHMMNDGRFADAVFAYESIIDKKIDMKDELKGDIMHNMACALTGLFFFKRAAVYFEKAYRLNRNINSLDSLLYSCLFSEDEELFMMMVNRYQVLPEDADKIKTTFNNSINGRKSAEYVDEITNKLSRTKDDVEKEFVFSDILSEFKSDYRNLRTY